MTLTRRLNDFERAVWMSAAERHFGEAFAVPRRVTAITLFSQDKAVSAFRIAGRVRLAA